MKSGSRVLGEGLIKPLISEFQRRVKKEKVRVVLHALLHTVYSFGYEQGRKDASDESKKRSI